MYRVLVSTSFKYLPEVETALAKALTRDRFTVHMYDVPSNRSHIVRVVMPIPGRVARTQSDFGRVPLKKLDDSMIVGGFSLHSELPNGFIIKPFRDYVYDPRGVLRAYYDYTV